MSAEVTIHIRGIKDVLSVPLQSVVGGSEMGTKRKVFVKTDAGMYEEREVVLGIFNDKVIEVREGIKEGEEVVINPKVLMGDSKQKTRDGAAPGTDGKGGAPGGGKGGAPDGLPGGDKENMKKKFKGGGGGGGPPA